jgi:ketosteroid isomerase-like protein
MTPEEQLIQRYFDAFNRHEIEGVMACFHGEVVLVGPNGKRLVDRAEVRRSYETEFALFPDAHCDLRLCTGNSGRGMAESLFTGTRRERGRIEGARCRSNGDRGRQNQGDPRLSSAVPSKAT